MAVTGFAKKCHTRPALALRPTERTARRTPTSGTGDRSAVSRPKRRARWTYCALVFVAAGPLACSKLPTKSKAAAAAASAAASLSAHRAQAEASAAAAASAAAEATLLANAAAIERAKQLVTDLKWMAAHNVTQNPANAGEGDASTKCGTVASAQTSLGAASSPDLRKILEEAASLCAFEIPIATATEAIEQLRFASSQASRRLHCDVAGREIERARSIRTKDARIRSLEARRREACHI